MPSRTAIRVLSLLAPLIGVGTARFAWAAQTEINLDAVQIPAVPRILSAGRIGTFPGSAFFHAIAVTGDRPLSYSATGLPTGLLLDATSGRITGSIAAAGEYPVVLRASNAAGAAERTITIVAGDTQALTPPMGWNSYDSFDDSVTESEMIAQATFQRDNLQQFGWEYVVVDFRWYDANAPASDQGNANATLTADGNGRLQPATSRFPSAANGMGFKPLGDQIHAMGLKFGIHIMRGIPRQAQRNDSPIADSTFTAREAADTSSVCPWNADMFGVQDNAAGRAWYHSIFKQYAVWGVDFVKVDDSTYNRAPVEYHETDVQFIHDAIVASGRNMVLSLSPGETPTSAVEHLTDVANMWRMSDDFWDRPRDLDHMFELGKNWQIVTGPPGHWPDADMLPFGVLGPRSPVESNQRTQNRTRFTGNEQVTTMSFWALLPSPLMLGANLVQSGSDAFTTALLTNEEVLAINQDALGARAEQISAQGTWEVWAKDLSGGEKAVGLFNRGSDDQRVTVTFAELGLSGAQTVRDVWKRSELPNSTSGLDFSVPFRGALLFVVAPPGDGPGTGGAGGMPGSAGVSAGGASAGGTPALGGNAGNAASGAGGASGGIPGRVAMGGVTAGGGMGAVAGAPSSSGSGGIANSGGGAAVSGAPARGGSFAGGAPDYNGGATTGGPATEASGCGCGITKPGRLPSEWGALLALGLLARKRRRRPGAKSSWIMRELGFVEGWGIRHSRWRR